MPWTDDDNVLDQPILAPPEPVYALSDPELTRFINAKLDDDLGSKTVREALAYLKSQATPSKSLAKLLRQTRQWLISENAPPP